MHLNAIYKNSWNRKQNNVYVTLDSEPHRRRWEVKTHPDKLPDRNLPFLLLQYRPHSIILASCKPGCKPDFRPGLQPGFRQVRVGLRHAFDQLSTFLSKTCCINLDMLRLMQQVRWFVRVLGKWKVEKTVLSQPTSLLKLDFRYVFYYSCLSWRN